jgi:hypothetical protein
MMRNTILQSLIVASLVTLATSAGAQNATPREPTPGQDQPLTGITQNGSPVGTMPSTAPAMDSQSNPQYNTILPTPPQRSTDDQMKAYQDARQACAGQPLAQQAACNDDANGRFGAVDPKCQRVSGSALTDCLRGADHGG